jgi:DNA-binding transcriptional ArsR family regulator
VLRIHFTADDLALTRLRTTANALWEVTLSHFRLHDRATPAYLRPWLQRLRNDPDRAARIRPAAQILAGLAPRGPYFPDFLTPAEAGEGLEAGLDVVASTPRQRLEHEVGLLIECSRRRRRRVPGWLRTFATGETLRGLAVVLHEYYEHAITPHQELIQASIDADVAQRARALLTGGLQGLFHSFAPVMRWAPPVLEIQYAVDKDLHLNGRGLVLVPSFFCRGLPVSYADPDLTPTVIYPIATQHRWATIMSASGQNTLAKLLGTTRAAVLTAVTNGASTTGLARTLSTSPASISRHTTVLREAGLLTAHRDGPAILHTHTPLGRQLLDNTRAER